MSKVLLQIKSLVASDIKQVNSAIEKNLHSNTPLINDISKYIINNGGKRLRPILVLISAKANNYVGKHHHTLAAVIEFIHTATLLHDDVVDDAQMRRNKLSANNKWGNQSAVLVGDFLYSRAFQMMLSANKIDILKVIADTTNAIAEGEVMQLLQRGNLGITTQQYEKIIHNKTAKLFETAAVLGAILADQPIDIINAWANFGLNIGRAFQIIDDLLDYQSNSEDLGKNIGQDFSEGKITMPIIYLLQETKNHHASLVKEALQSKETSCFKAIQVAIKESGALQYTLEQAKKAAKSARNSLIDLPSNIFHASALSLTDYVWQRSN